MNLKKTFTFKGINPLSNPDYQTQKWIDRLSAIRIKIDKIAINNKGVAMVLTEQADEFNDILQNQNQLKKPSQHGSDNHIGVVPRWLREEIQEFENSVNCVLELT